LSSVIIRFHHLPISLSANAENIGKNPLSEAFLKMLFSNIEVGWSFLGLCAVLLGVRRFGRTYYLNIQSLVNLVQAANFTHHSP
jgi:hypothetical protein